MVLIRAKKICIFGLQTRDEDQTTMNATRKIAVIGGGSWATAIVKMLSNNVSHLHWWVRNEETVNYIKNFKRNPTYLTSVELDTNKLILETNLKKVVQQADVLIMAVPFCKMHCKV